MLVSRERAANGPFLKNTEEQKQNCSKTMNTSLTNLDKAAPCFGQVKPAQEPAPLAGHPKGRTPCAAPLGHPTQTWPLRIGYRNCVIRRGWFNVWLALAIALSLFAVPLH